MVILPYKMKSKSAKVLAEALGVRRVRPDGKFKNNFNHTIVNWGYGGKIHFPHRDTINPPWAVDNAANKLRSFIGLKLHGVTTPEWATDRMVAQGWWANREDVVIRHKLRGHSGDGIEIMTGESYGYSPLDYLIPNAPLYVQYIKKQDEYRYHVFKGEVIDIQQKRKRRDVENEKVNYQIRNAHSGWVYCRDGITPSASLSVLAIDAVECLGLDFGAVDIIWNEHSRQGYVLEVNTACGLDGSTVDIYTEAIRRHCGH